MFQTEWHAIIIKPYGRLLDHGDSPKLYAQATYDVAMALQLCADHSIAHRDVTSNNIIVYNGRGVLCDFSAAKVSEGCATLPWCIYACKEANAYQIDAALSAASCLLSCSCSQNTHLLVYS